MGKTLSELEVLAARNGWTVRELTAEEIRNEMRPAEIEYHEKFNNAELTRALAEPERRAENRRNKAAWDAKRCWDEKATPEEAAAAIAEAEKFDSDYPQFLGEYSPANREALVCWLRDRNLPVRYANFVAGFEDLTLRGELILDGGICGVEDKEISGHALASHPQIYKLLQPHPTPTPEAREKMRVDRLSADQFKQERTELWDRRIPPMLKYKVVQILDTWTGQHPEHVHCPENEAAMTAAVLASGLPVSIQLLDSVYSQLLADGALKVDSSAVVEHGTTRLLNLGADEPRTPIVPHQRVEIADRVKKFTPQQIAKMTSREFEEWSKNPDFVEQVDNMKR